MVLTGTVAQLGRLGEDQVRVAQRNAEATEDVDIVAHGLDDLLRQLVGHNLFASLVRRGLVQLQGIEGYTVDFVGGVELAGRAGVFENPLLQLFAPDLGQAMVIDDD